MRNWGESESVIRGLGIREKTGIIHRWKKFLAPHIGGTRLLEVQVLIDNCL